jgi:DNA invertase Pin-like site-specific DNA recombinase
MSAKIKAKAKAKVALYARISTQERDGKQSLDCQRHALKAYAKSQGWTSDAYVWFLDEASGRQANRQGLDALRRAVARGDVSTVVVLRLDRLSRKVRDGLALLQEWADRGIRIVAIQQGLDFNGAMGKFLSVLFLALAEWEADLIRERVKEGMAAARAKGTVLGRPVNHDRHDQIRTLFRSGVGARQIAEMMNCKRAAVYASLKKSRGPQDAV